MARDDSRGSRATTSVIVSLALLAVLSAASGAPRDLTVVTVAAHVLFLVPLCVVLALGAAKAARVTVVVVTLLVAATFYALASATIVGALMPFHPVMIVTTVIWFAVEAVGVVAVSMLLSASVTAARRQRH